MPNKLIIAIDGPAGSGKSTTAKILADRIGYLYIDTGAMYRAITFLAIRDNFVNNSVEIINKTKNCKIELSYENGLTRVFVDGEEVTDFIREKDVNDCVSEISKIEEVRSELVRKQKELGKNGGVVMEGRDIGTVVFPHADVKVFLTASIDERAVRRTKEYVQKGKNIPMEDVKHNLETRDKIDSSRIVSPLKIAEDAFIVDTTALTVDEQVNEILIQINKILELKND